MAQDTDFLTKLNQHYGQPKDVALDAIKKATEGKNILEIGGMAICAKKFPEIPTYAGLAGAGAGIIVTLLGVFIYNTFFRRRHHTVVTNNLVTPAK
ncbi:MAG: hypothetical protein EOO77_11035 [Oxalobacteraceae bacterium]|nr:MAG: hypothetical protein EOO77_11035 [Oxalobacteraceae bacterium]